MAFNSVYVSVKCTVDQVVKSAFRSGFQTPNEKRKQQQHKNDRYGDRRNVREAEGTHKATISRTTMSAIFDFSSLMTVLLLLICTCAYLRELRPTVFDDNAQVRFAHLLD